MYTPWDFIFDITKENYLEGHRVSVVNWYNAMKTQINSIEKIEKRDRDKLLQDLNLEASKRLQAIEQEGHMLSIDKELVKRLSGGR